MTTVRNREEAAQAAEHKTTNVPGTCQKVTHMYYNPSGALSVGDRDGDRDADANDGWRSEPESARHYGDRKPPRGVPLYFRNRIRSGPRAFGHRTISVGHLNGVTRSTDFSGGRYVAGVVGTGTIAQVEDAMGLEYVGWSKTISGILIPEPPKPPPTRVENFWKAGGPPYQLAILDRAAENGREDVAKVLKRIDVAVNKLPKDRGTTRVTQFVKAYHQYRVLRMGLLNQAVDAGRHGTVEHVRDEIRHQLHDVLAKK